MDRAVRLIPSQVLISSSLRISAYLCDLCVKYFSRLQLTQRSQRYAEIRREDFPTPRPMNRLNNKRKIQVHEINAPSDRRPGIACTLDQPIHSPADLHHLARN